MQCTYCSLLALCVCVILHVCVCDPACVCVHVCACDLVCAHVLQCFVGKCLLIFVRFICLFMYRFVFGYLHTIRFCLSCKVVETVKVLYKLLVIIILVQIFKSHCSKKE